MNKHLTVSTGTARPYKPALTVSKDAQEIASEVGKKVGSAVHQALLDAASLGDAKLRRIVEKHHGAEVADGLAGAALAALAKQCKEGGGPATNSMRAWTDDPTTYFKPLTSDLRNLPKE